MAPRKQAPASDRSRDAARLRVLAGQSWLEGTSRGRVRVWDASATELWELIGRRVSRQVATRVDYGTEPDEVTALLVIRFISEPAFRARYTTRDEDGTFTVPSPFAHLNGCAVRALRDMVAAAAVRLDAGLDTGGSRELITSRGASAVGAAREDEKTSLGAAGKDVLALLLPGTPEDLRVEVSHLVEWLAWNPPQSESHARGDIDAAAAAFPELTRAQVSAIASLCWGARPDRAGTSLFARFLEPVTDTRYPGESDAQLLDRVRPMNNTVRRALCDYRIIMRRRPARVPLAA